MNDSETLEVFRFVVENEMASSLFFGTDDNGALWIAENCNDLFYWACADMEEITLDKLPLLKKCIEDCDKAYIDHKGEHQDGYGHIYAGTLYACRVRGMRPQNPCYSSWAPWLRALLDTCGPDRPETGDRAKAEAKYEANLKMKTCAACSGRGRVSL